MTTTRLLGVLCACAVSLITTPSYATLIGVLPATPGGTDYQAYYDSVADLTWLANANAAGTTMNWADANAWAASLSINGVTGWRLPDTNPVDGTTADDANFSYIGTEDRGYNVSAPGTLYAGSTASEMAYLFYNTLGNLGYCDPGTSTVSTCSGPQTGWGLSNTGPFSNVQSYFYWSSTEYAPDPAYAWYFDFGYGDQLNGVETYNLYAWAVQSGNAGVVPVPAAVWLFGSGLLGLVGLGKPRRR